MKNILLFLLPVYFFSQNSNTSNPCFGDGTREYFGKLLVNDSEETIIAQNPNHIKFYENKNHLSYEKDKKNRYGTPPANEQTFQKWHNAYEKKYAGFIKYFGNSFSYIQIQAHKKESFAIAENRFGYWLLEIKNNNPKAYYIGFSKYTHINYHQDQLFIKDNTLSVAGSFVRDIQAVRYQTIEPVKDFLTFEVPLDEIRKDSDQDGYNDFFEHLIYLNPYSKDSDNDGISDFFDTNPLYAFESNQFSNLYEQIIDGKSENADNPYNFDVYRSDCEYFQHVNSKKNRVLIFTEKQSYEFDEHYRRDLYPTIYNKIIKDPKDNIFRIPYHTISSGGEIIAVYENGQWTITEHQTYII